MPSEEPTLSQPSHANALECPAANSLPPHDPPEALSSAEAHRLALVQVHDLGVIQEDAAGQAAPLFLDKPDRSPPWKHIRDLRTHEVYKFFDEQVSCLWPLGTRLGLILPIPRR